MLMLCDQDNLTDMCHNGIKNFWSPCSDVLPGEAHWCNAGW